MNTAPNAATPQNVRPLPQRSCIYSRARGPRLVEVIEEKYPDGRLYLVVVTGLFNDTKTITGPIWSQADAMRMARLGGL
jgi:hypothetical protein